MTLNFLIRRVLTALLTLVLSSALVFSALLIVPGDPVQLILGLNYEPTQYAMSGLSLTAFSYLKCYSPPPRQCP